MYAFIHFSFFSANPSVVDSILSVIRLHGFTIIAKERLLMSLEQAQDFYAEHRGKPFYDKLTVFMSRSESEEQEQSGSDREGSKGS